jgi:hypothetical protein
MSTVGKGKFDSRQKTVEGEKENSYCSVSLIVAQWLFVIILKAFETRSFDIENEKLQVQQKYSV